MSPEHNIDLPQKTGNNENEFWPRVQDPTGLGPRNLRRNSSAKKNTREAAKRSRPEHGQRTA
eukprot:4019824-Prymnesium_polylepis.2